jgi:hypothetical protein
MPAGHTSGTGAERDAERRPRRDRATVGFLATVIVLLYGALGAELAGAGTYVMRNCNVPGHPAAPMHPWVAVDNPVTDVSIADACGTGGGVGFVLGDARQLPPNQNAQIIIEQPTAPRSQITFVKVVLWYAARLTGAGSPVGFMTHYLLPDGSGAFGPFTSPPGAESLVAEQQLSPRASSYYVSLHCGPLGTAVLASEPCVAAERVPLLIRGMEVTLREDVPPSVARPTGTLLESGLQSGIRTLAYSASDPHSGLSKVDVLLGDTVVATHDLTTRCTHSDFTVCPASLDETLPVDTRAVINGRHHLTLRVQDAAGNERTVDSGHVVDVVNETSSGAADGPLTIKFNGTSRSTLVVPYARRVTLRGRLAEGSQPVAAGTPVELLERSEGEGKREQATARVKTKADGSFSVRLSTTRPSRTLRMVYRPAADKEVVSRTLKLRVQAASSVRASLRGRIVRFTGRVLSRPVPRAGKRVVMEGRSPGSAWTAFETLRTDRRGRFSGTYRLRVRRPGVTLKVRAFVPLEGGYGYLGSRSRAVTFRVR